jgi:hypothetical protein
MSGDYMLPVANHLWQSTLFGIAVWLITLTLRKNRFWRLSELLSNGRRPRRVLCR